MKKELNKTGAKRELLKTFDEADKKLERDRWLKTPEGVSWVLGQIQKQETEKKKVSMKPGQLVWTTVMVKTDSMTLYECQRCSKIIQVNLDDTVLIQMLFVLVDQKKELLYEHPINGLVEKDTLFLVDILDLNMHVAKVSKNIWWKEL